MSYNLDQLIELLLRPTFSVAGVEVPTFLLIAICFFSYSTHFLLRLRKRKPWRIASSRKWLKQFRANKERYSPQQRFAYIRKADHFLWEEILMTCFEERGYKIQRTKMTRDGGSDGFVKVNNQNIIIQAKRYKGPIAKAHVLELEAIVQRTKRLDKGLFIHTGKTSAPLLRYFRNNQRVELLSGVDTVLNFLDGKGVVLFGETLNSIR